MLPYSVSHEVSPVTQSRLYLAALLLFPPAPAAGAGAALGAVFLLARLRYEQLSATRAYFHGGTVGHGLAQLDVGGAHEIGRMLRQ